MSSICRPWFKWYPKDFVADEKVRALSPLAELVYRRILDIQWETSECRLPNDIDYLFRVTGKGISREDFEAAWGEIQYPDFEILKNTEKWVWSKRLKQQFIDCIEKSGKAQQSAMKRWGKNSERNAIEIRTDSERIEKAHADIDTDKDIDKKKGKKRFTPPSEQEVIKYFQKNGYTTTAAKKAFNYYDVAGWKDATGKQVKNWKQKMIAVWFKDENKKNLKQPDNPESSKLTCSAGPCQKTVKKQGDYCKDCQEVLSDANCTTYGQFVGIDNIDKINDLTEGIGK